MRGGGTAGVYMVEPLAVAVALTVVPLSPAATLAVALADAMVAWLAVLKFPLCTGNQLLIP